MGGETVLQHVSNGCSAPGTGEGAQGKVLDERVCHRISEEGTGPRPHVCGDAPSLWSEGEGWYQLVEVVLQRKQGV